ncbi:RES family NAD+ phosphorylase [Croceicoccus gelatinilyticus]|uniref:RES family NAD+ phosphorylase n=1 Tax=Croceicoccus gelatinilyticus TaxID=2835536 RepID=UPI001BCABEFB|nr:RES family NAD+ phosphorylase [Croceicoccus gelatinilyticus]MBS7671761.1 RES family NAD+ phosphorylase [Croceicoccus gelatinilyticus]
MQFSGIVYRALNPIYARMPLSGAGAGLYGGRLNPKGRDALYTSLEPETALREANQVGTMQPTTLVAYEADIGPIIDARQASFFVTRNLAHDVISDPAWRSKMLAGEPMPSQDLAETLIAEGYAGIFVPSFVRGAKPDAVNLVLWQWDGMLSLIDDDNRLGAS